MIKIPNKLVIFGAVAAAALAVPGVLGPLMFEEAHAARDNNNEQSAEALNRAGDSLVNVQAAVGANVNAQDVSVTACILASGPCTSD
jgi:hypothetical protein